MPESVRVAVYGSLREGEYNNGRFGPQKMVKLTRTIPGYYLVNLGAYPALVRDPNFGAREHPEDPSDFAVPSSASGVVVEVHEIPSEMLRWWDAMEHGAGYTREKVSLTDGEEVWAYLQPVAEWHTGRVVPSGDWKDRKGVQN